MIKVNSTSQKHKTIRFNKWSNKKYSVFNSLKRVIKISTLNVAYSIVILPIQLIAQTDTTRIIQNIDLEEVVVSAERSPVVYSSLARIVTIIDNQDFGLMPVTCINELIESGSFVDIRQRGSNGVQADISIRGGTFDQNLILLNGINISDPQTGHHSLNLPIDLNSVQRIEILEGPGSRIFGPNAFSGAINIITNQSDKNYIRSRFAIGDFGLYSGSISGSIKNKKFGQFISVSKTISGGYTQNTDYDNMNIFYNPYLNSKIGKIDFQIGYTNRAFGANSFYTPEYPDQYEQIKTTFSSLKLETGNKIKIIPAVYYRAHKDRFELFRTKPATWYSGHNYHYTQVYGAKIDARFSWSLGNTSLGAEYRSENILSNKLGLPMNDTIEISDEPNGFYDKEYARDITNIFMEHSIYLDKFSITAGMLGSYLDEKNNKLSFYPGIDISFKIADNLRIYSSINKSLRLPTFTDLFYTGPKNNGNPNLVPEEAWSYEGGIRFYSNSVNSNGSVFFRDSENLIEWVRHKDSTQSAKWETQNLTEVKTFGIQFQTKIKLHDIYENQLVKEITLNYAYLNQSIASNNYETKYSLNYLKHNMNLTILHKVLKKVDLSWNFKYQDRAGEYQLYNFQDKTYEPEKEFKPVFIVDAKLIWKHKWLNVFIESTNLFNVSYADFANMNMPGRWFVAGLELNYSW